MKIVERALNSTTRSTEFKLYVLGDVHIGALNCAEKEFRKLVTVIEKDPNARWIGGGDYCLPLGAEMLTQRGFKQWDELEIGEPVAAYDGSTLVWTPLRSVYLTAGHPFVRMHNSMFDMTGTENHEWWVHDGHRARRNSIESPASKVPTKDLKAGQRIITAAPMRDALESVLTDNEVELLTWIVTDGHIKDGRSGYIYQSKEPYRTEIREHLRGWYTSETEDGRFYLSRPKLNALLGDRLGITRSGLRAAMPGLVTQMSQSQRRLCFETMLKAEGWEDGRWLFSQKDGPIMDAFQILAALLGERLTPVRYNADEVGITSVVKRSQHVTVADLKMETIDEDAAWCPSTDHRSWVCRYRGQVTITGNCDAVILGDVKRFDISTLPNWMLRGNPKTIKERIGDILYAQRNRFCRFVDPIKDKCLGLIEGNHEYTIFKYHNRDHMGMLCDKLEVENLTDCTFIRLRFNRVTSKGKRTTDIKSMSSVVFACHGHGGGRTPGTEPNRLYRLAADKDVDVVLTGHSHTFNIMPPMPILWVPRTGQLPEDSFVKEKHAANWGSFLYTYKAGASTYASRATYPVRPMYTVETVFYPHRMRHGFDRVDIVMREIKL